MTMDELMPPDYPYVIENLGFGDRFITVHYSDPAGRVGEIVQLNQLVFPANLVEEEIGELVDLICELVEKVQVMRRGPSARIVPRAVADG